MSEATKLDSGGIAGSLAYRTAELRLAAFVTESQLLAASSGPIHPADCEAILQLGVDAFQWLMRIDRQYRIAMFRGEAPHRPDLEHVLYQDCVTWLDRAAAVRDVLTSARGSKLQLDNRESFLLHIDEMTAIVAANQADDTHDDLPPKMIPLRDSAVAEQKNGQTAEFI